MCTLACLGCQCRIAVFYFISKDLGAATGRMVKRWVLFRHSSSMLHPQWHYINIVRSPWSIPFEPCMPSVLICVLRRCSADQYIVVVVEHSVRASSVHVPVMAYIYSVAIEPLESKSCSFLCKAQNRIWTWHRQNNPSNYCLRKFLGFLSFQRAWNQHP